ncbi:hypothetical protein SAMN04488490_1425 [Marinobacter sp. LV10R510-11A]|nr:hypothetical protein SAMN04488490_1425 [Marinobacter sp. LV10R510-11A]
MSCDAGHVATHCFRLKNIVTVCLAAVTLGYEIVMDYSLLPFKNGSY